MSSTESLKNDSSVGQQTESLSGIPIFSWMGSNIVLVFIFSGLVRTVTLYLFFYLQWFDKNDVKNFNGTGTCSFILSSVP